MNTWKADSFDHFIEAARLLFGDDRLQFKRVKLENLFLLGLLGYVKLNQPMKLLQMGKEGFLQ